MEFSIKNVLKIIEFVVLRDGDISVSTRISRNIQDMDYNPYDYLTIENKEINGINFILRSY